MNEESSTEKESGKSILEETFRYYSRLISDRLSHSEALFSTESMTPPQSYWSGEYHGLNSLVLSLAIQERGAMHPMFLTRERLEGFNYSVRQRNGEKVRIPATDRKGNPLPEVKVRDGEEPFPIIAISQVAAGRNPDDVISEKEYRELSELEQSAYVLKDRMSVRYVYSIDQTNLSEARPDKYQKYLSRLQEGTPALKTGNFTIGEVDSMFLKGDAIVPVIFSSYIDGGYYSPTRGAIILSESLKGNPAGYYTELFRQLVKVHRIKAGKLRVSDLSDDRIYARERMLSELGSAILCRHYGLSTVAGRESLNYLNTWRKMVEEDLNGFMDSMASLRYVTAEIADRIRLSGEGLLPETEKYPAAKVHREEIMEEEILESESQLRVVDRELMDVDGHTGQKQYGYSSSWEDIPEVSEPDEVQQERGYLLSESELQELEEHLDAIGFKEGSDLFRNTLKENGLSLNRPSIHEHGRDIWAREDGESVDVFCCLGDRLASIRVDRETYQDICQDTMVLDALLDEKSGYSRGLSYDYALMGRMVKGSYKDTEKMHPYIKDERIYLVIPSDRLSENAILSFLKRLERENRLGGMSIADRTVILSIPLETLKEDGVRMEDFETLLNSTEVRIEKGKDSELSIVLPVGGNFEKGIVMKVGQEPRKEIPGEKVRGRLYVCRDRDGNDFLLVLDSIRSGMVYSLALVRNIGVEDRLWGFRQEDGTQHGIVCLSLDELEDEGLLRPACPEEVRRFFGVLERIPESLNALSDNGISSCIMQREDGTEYMDIENASAATARESLWDYNRFRLTDALEADYEDDVIRLYIAADTGQTVYFLHDKQEGTFREITVPDFVSLHSDTALLQELRDFYPVQAEELTAWEQRSYSDMADLERNAERDCPLDCLQVFYYLHSYDFPSKWCTSYIYSDDYQRNKISAGAGKAAQSAELPEKSVTITETIGRQETDTEGENSRVMVYPFPKLPKDPKQGEIADWYMPFGLQLREGSFSPGEGIRVSVRSTRPLKLWSKEELVDHLRDNMAGFDRLESRICSIREDYQKRLKEMETGLRAAKVETSGSQAIDGKEVYRNEKERLLPEWKAWNELREEAAATLRYAQEEAKYAVSAYLRSSPYDCIEVGEPAWPGYMFLADYRDVTPMADESVDTREYLFVGQKGMQKTSLATFRLDNLDVARMMEKEGSRPAVIKMATEWERGKDGKWRMEAADGEFTRTLQEAVRPMSGGYAGCHLGDIWKNDALTEAYPNLQDLLIRIEKHSTSRIAASYESSRAGNFLEDTILVSPRLLEQGEDLQRGMILHEIQHYIQEKEGFAFGAGPLTARSIEDSLISEYMASRHEGMTSGKWNWKVDELWLRVSDLSRRENLPELYDMYHTGPMPEGNAGGELWNAYWRHEDEVRENVAALYREGGRLIPETIYERITDRREADSLEALASQLRSWNLDYKQVKDSGRFRQPSDLYYRWSGEVEARNVQHRTGMTPLERLSSLASDTADVALEDQLYIRRGVLEEAVPLVTEDMRQKVNGAILMSLRKAGIDVYIGDLPLEDCSSRHSPELSDTSGRVIGWTENNRICLTDCAIEPSALLHEYTHLWARAMEISSPELWQEIVSVIKQTPLWQEVSEIPFYGDRTKDENRLASECLARLSGERNASRLLVEAGKEENPDSSSLVENVFKALNRFWDWVGSRILHLEKAVTLDNISDRILSDLLGGRLQAAQNGMESRQDLKNQMEERDGTFAKVDTPSHLDLCER